MSIFLAAMINCGAMIQPNGKESPRVCMATVFHAINAPKNECENTAVAEAATAELRLVKGGFVNTKSVSKCFTLSDDDASDESLTKYMRQEMGATKTHIMRMDFRNGKFVKREAPKVPGHKL